METRPTPLLRHGVGIERRSSEYEKFVAVVKCSATIFVPAAAAVFSRSGEKRNLGQKCSELAMTGAASDRRNERSNDNAIHIPGGVDTSADFIESALMTSPPRTCFADMRFKLTL